MKFGYVRVSTRMQNTDRQVDELRKECDRIFVDYGSGKNTKRPQLKQMMSQIRGGDRIVVLRLSRFGRSAKDLADLADQILTLGASLHSKKEGFTLDGSPMGKMLYTIMSALAEFERDIIRERTKEGLRAAAARGRRGGRPKGLTDEAAKKAKLVAKLYRDDDWSIREIAKNVGIGTTTVYNYLRHQGIEPNGRVPAKKTPVEAVN